MVHDGRGAIHLTQLGLELFEQFGHPDVDRVGHVVHFIDTQQTVRQFKHVGPQGDDDKLREFRPVLLKQRIKSADIS